MQRQQQQPSPMPPPGWRLLGFHFKIRLARPQHPARHSLTERIVPGLA
jgi:hypothetical protein